MRSSVISPPPGFEWVHAPGVTMLVRSDARAWMLPVLAGTGGGTESGAGRELAGGRGGARVVVAGAHEVVLRSCRRGGLPARLLHDTYFGWHPRPFRELCALEVLRQRGAPVVEAYGATVQWLLPGCYRGALATRYVRGAQTLWEWVRAPHPAAQRATVFRAIGTALRRLHASGARHPDLNLNNILVCPRDGGAPEILFIDFDRARIVSEVPAAFATDLDRLARSARKLDPQGHAVATADLQMLREAYQESQPCA